MSCCLVWEVSGFNGSGLGKLFIDSRVSHNATPWPCLLTLHHSLKAPCGCVLFIKRLRAALAQGLPRKVAMCSRPSFNDVAARVP